jgi:hypothetical protein
LTDIVATQDEVVRNIVDALAIKLFARAVNFRTSSLGRFR